ncbi:MAG: GntR family transcriptional regulator, partial [Acidobacteria bacterium]|nr:GntR family transcriptional regulator [Acidobacteriota bacterium]
MLIDIDPEDSRPLYRQIVDEVQRSVTVGALNEGEALPAARRLAAELRINPNTVRQAYRRLERDGSPSARSATPSAMASSRVTWSRLSGRLPLKVSA